MVQTILLRRKYLAFVKTSLAGTLNKHALAGHKSRYPPNSTEQPIQWVKHHHNTRKTKP